MTASTSADELPFDLPEYDDHEQICIGRDPQAGLYGFVAIHSTARGPALGGCRMVPYASGAQAYADALRLSQAMSYKNALAGLPHGGGKAVIWADPARDKTPDLLRAMGRFMATLQGRYITAGDVGISVADLDVIGESNPWTTGRSPDKGGAGDSGILTAFGVWQGMRASAMHAWGSPDLTDRLVGIEGVGKVGGRLAVHLVQEAGARVVVTDADPAALARLSAEIDVTVVESRAELLAQPLDIFSPNALGQVLTPELAVTLTARIVCGGANNQVAAASVPALLAERGVLYAPDFLVNCGGVVQVADEVLGFDEQRARGRVAGVYDTALEVFARAEASGATPVVAATEAARERIALAEGEPFSMP